MQRLILIKLCLTNGALTIASFAIFSKFIPFHLIWNKERGLVLNYLLSFIENIYSSCICRYRQIRCCYEYQSLLDIQPTLSFHISVSRKLKSSIFHFSAEGKFQKYSWSYLETSAIVPPIFHIFYICNILYCDTNISQTFSAKLFISKIFWF